MGKHIPQSTHEGTILKDRFTSEDIFERIIQVAGEEITTGRRELFFSALAAGFAITLTFFLYATLTYKTDAHPIFSAILYPLGFLYIVLGNYQLFTENTLPPVALVIERMASIPSLLRVWGVVLFGNLFGGFIGAAILAFTGIFSSGAASTAVDIATKVTVTPWQDLLVRGAMAGFIVAGIVWLDYASRDNGIRFFLIYTGFLAIPLGGLNHIVVTATEISYLSFTVGTPLLPLLWSTALPVLIGNTLGGVILVTVVNYFQTPHFIQEDPKKRLSMDKWLFSFCTFKDKKRRRK